MENKIQTEALDMRVLIPIERHKKLIQLFKELPVDKSFIFIKYILPALRLPRAESLRISQPCLTFGKRMKKSGNRSYFTVTA